MQDGGGCSRVFVSMQEPFISSDIMNDLFFATYGELILLTNAWKMHGSLSHIVVNILIELASNTARYTGGKLAMGRHPNACPMSKSGT